MGELGRFFRETQGVGPLPLEARAAGEPDDFWVKNYLENGLKLPKMQKIYIKMFRIVFEKKHSSSTLIYLALSNILYVILLIGYIQYNLSLVISTFYYISKFK